MVVLLAAVSLLCLASLWLDRHLALSMLLTVIGFSLAGVFVLMQAPDVALAQVLVETLASLSIVLALYLSGQVRPETTTVVPEKPHQVGRWSLAIGMGTLLGTGTYLGARAHPEDAVGTRYAAEAEIIGKHDFVAAVLTEFRALDTLVEVTVFATAVIACAGLFWKHRGQA
jgi:multicomponent Na+:H+ antiporter subunit A